MYESSGCRSVLFYYVLHFIARQTMLQNKSSHIHPISNTLWRPLMMFSSKFHTPIYSIAKYLLDTSHAPRVCSSCHGCWKQNKTNKNFWRFSFFPKEVSSFPWVNIDFKFLGQSYGTKTALQFMEQTLWWWLLSSASQTPWKMSIKFVTWEVPTKILPTVDYSLLLLFVWFEQRWSSLKD